MEMTLLLVAFLLALVPLRSLTGRQANPEIPPIVHPSVAEVSLIPVKMRLRFTGKPVRVEVKHLGKTLWAEDVIRNNEVEARTQLDLPEEGIDLLLNLQWAERESLSAVELTLEPEGIEERSVTVWGRGEVSDVLTFQW